MTGRKKGLTLAFLIYFITILWITVGYIEDEKAKGRDMCTVKETVIMPLNSTLHVPYSDTLMYDDVFTKIDLWEYNFTYHSNIDYLTNTYRFSINNFAIDNNIKYYDSIYHYIKNFNHLYSYTEDIRHFYISDINSSLFIFVEQSIIDNIMILNPTYTYNDALREYLQTNNIYGVFERNDYIDDTTQPLGKNLINLPNEYTIFNDTTDEIYWNHFDEEIEVLPNTTYTVSFAWQYDSVEPFDTQLFVLLDDIDGVHTYLSWRWYNNEPMSYRFAYATFTTRPDTVKLSLRFDHNGNTNIDSSSTLFYKNIQLEKGSTFTEYEPYQTKLTYLKDTIFNKFKNNINKTGIGYQPVQEQESCVSILEIGKVAFRDGILGMVPYIPENGGYPPIRIPFVDVYLRNAKVLWDDYIFDSVFNVWKSNLDFMAEFFKDFLEILNPF